MFDKETSCYALVVVNRVSKAQLDRLDLEDHKVEKVHLENLELQEALGNLVTQ